MRSGWEMHRAVGHTGLTGAWARLLARLVRQQLEARQGEERIRAIPRQDLEIGVGVRQAFRVMVGPKA